MSTTELERSVVEPLDADDASIAYSAASEAGRELLSLGSGFIWGEALGKAGDRLSHEILCAKLLAARPNDAILSEEASDDPTRIHRDRVWIIDPLDGTREFGEPGRTDWAVHVALVCEQRLSMGVVALPARGRIFTSAEPPPLPARSGPLRIVVSRTRPPAIAFEVARRLEAQLIPMGSAGAKAMSILLGESDVYLHAGGQYLWDSAAPVAVARAAGLHASRLDGSPLLYNLHPAWQPDLLIARPELAQRVLEAVRESSQ